jgi:protein-S-isoprenylcysteine O-methyltransferase Ste14
MCLQQQRQYRQYIRGGVVMKPSTDRRERPNVVPWPPIIFAGTIVAALVLEFAYPLDAVLPWSGAVRFIGAAAMLVGVVVDVAAMREMHRNRANIQPHRAATALVTRGLSPCHATRSILRTWC